MDLFNQAQYDADLTAIRQEIAELRAMIETEEPAPPFPGIQAAYDALPEDAMELVIPSGAYTEDLTLNRPCVEVRGEDDVHITGRIQIAANDVTLRNVTVIEGEQASPDYWGTIWSDGVDRVRLFDVAVSSSAWAGVAIKGGVGHLMRHVDAHDNGALGIRLESIASSNVENCTMRGNNTRGLDPGWEAGGLKATGNYGGISSVSVAGCTVHDNDGPGIWFDIDASNCNIINNRVYDNTRAGILYELSETGWIKNNTVYRNGSGFPAWGFGAGILIQNAKGCEVSGNIVAWNSDGIIVMSQDRGEARWNDVTNNRLENNVVAHIDGTDYNTFASAVLQDWAGNAAGPESGNVGIGNRYYYSQGDQWILRHRNGNDYWHEPAGPFAGDTVIDLATVTAILNDAGIA